MIALDLPSSSHGNGTSFNQPHDRKIAEDLLLSVAKIICFNSFKPNLCFASQCHVVLSQVLSLNNLSRPSCYYSSSLLSSDTDSSLNLISSVFSTRFFRLDCVSAIPFFAMNGLSRESAIRTASSVRIVLLPW